MKDNYGDKIEVEANALDELIELRVTDSSDFTTVVAQADLSPTKARKLAKLLKAAANEIDRHGGEAIYFKAST